MTRLYRTPDHLGLLLQYPKRAAGPMTKAQIIAEEHELLPLLAVLRTSPPPHTRVVVSHVTRMHFSQLMAGQDYLDWEAIYAEHPNLAP